ncbi:hypothetical protein LDENG_00051800 [Lucifuga dentata]|nr:hypothetical protein LDENG_00051800 [Lucifuga dentata]
MALNISSIRDTKWLTVEVCRQFQRGNCSRSDEECRFAHPPKSCQVENGKVVTCFDSIKGQCSRENCKYLHPPSHLKNLVEINGRNSLIQQKTAASMFARQMQLMIPGPNLQPLGLGANTGLGYGPYIRPLNHGMSLVAPEMLPRTPMIIPANPPVMFQSSSSPSLSSSASSQKFLRADKLQVCREFQRGSCARGEIDCRFAHPTDGATVDSSQNTVTVCMDYIKSCCSREKCKYFHPPTHLQEKIKASQQQAIQTAVAAQTSAAAMTQSTAKAMKRPLDATVDLAFPHGVLQSLPKRQVLEKSIGVTSVFPNLLHYQQALANPHQQQQQPTAAFYPTGSVYCMTPTINVVPMMYSATPATVSAASTPAPSVLYAATAPANQIILK